MVTTIAHHDLTRIGPKLFATDASCIGLRPGDWPERVLLNSGVTTMILKRAKRLDSGGEFAGYAYRSAGGHTIEVFND